MGMYDDLRCEMPLPDGMQRMHFQTKSLDCELNQYVITAEGRLLVEDIYNADLQAPVDYTGEIEFYALDSRRGWVEYVALVERGQVLSLIDPRDETNPIKEAPCAPLL